MHTGVIIRMWQVVAVAFLAAGYANNVSAQGPLDPAGAPGPAMKTLDQVRPGTPISALPYSITQPGFYFLTGNLTGTSGTNGITIEANDVSLDLGGFAMYGVPGTADGISVGPVAEFRQRIVIRNGGLSGWGGYGINAAYSLQGSFSQLVLYSNVLSGLYSGSGSVLEGVQASYNGGDGLRVLADSSVVRCLAMENLGHGMNIAQGCSVHACQSKQNGLRGFFSGGRIAVSDSTARANLGDGFYLGYDAVAQNCSSHGNGGIGFFLLNGSTVDRCSAGSNVSNGFYLVNSIARGCQSGYNNAHGMYVEEGSTVRGSTVVGNRLDGIYVMTDNIIEENSIFLNGNGLVHGAGVYADGFRNRIEANHVRQNDTGIEVSNSGNFIARNTCSGNSTNWNVAPANACLVIQAMTAGSILGISGGASPGSTDPNANYSH